MNLIMPVSKLMTTQLMMLSPNDSVSEAKKIFNTFNINQIPVIDSGKFVGLVNKINVSTISLEYLELDNELRTIFDKCKIRKVMTADVKTLHPSDKLVLALEILKENYIESLPVVENDKLLGIITTHDIIERLAIDNEAYIEYEE